MNDHAERHAALHDSLMALGATADEIDAAVRDERLPELVTDLVLWPERERITIAEAALRSGVSPDVARTAVMRLGLPVPDEDEARLVAKAVDALLVLRGGAELFGEDAMLQFTRVVGSACSAIAEAAVSVFGVGLASGRLDPGRDQFDYAATVLETTMAFTSLGPAVDIVLRQHFEAAAARLGPRASAQETPFAVAFVDLVGSTALGQAVEASALAGVLSEFDDCVAEIASEHGVRLVKLLGDGAMLVARDPVELVAACRALLVAVRSRPLLDLARAGVAFGMVVARDGDYFGTVVNLAARMADAAEPGEILCDTEVAGILDGKAEAAGMQRLKGFDAPVAVFRVR